jgi:hypothetical protein
MFGCCEYGYPVEPYCAASTAPIWSSPALERAISTSSSVRFFDLRNALRLSIGETETEGSRRTSISLIS